MRARKQPVCASHTASTCGARAGTRKKPLAHSDLLLILIFASLPVSRTPPLRSLQEYAAERLLSLSLSLMSLIVMLLLRATDPYRWKLLATLPRRVVVRVFCARRCCFISNHELYRIEDIFSVATSLTTCPAFFRLFLIGYGITCVRPTFRFRDAQPKKKRTKRKRNGRLALFYGF